MREELTAALKNAAKTKDAIRLSTIRLVLAAIKDRDIANRGAGKDPVSDEEILQILGKMIKQREESARIYEEASRLELAEKEREEIEVIRSFLPKQLSDEAVQKACRKVVQDTGAQGLRDMGRCMNALKSEFAGKMDFSKASGVVKDLLKHDQIPALSRQYWQAGLGAEPHHVGTNMRAGRNAPAGSLVCHCAWLPDTSRSVTKPEDAL